MADPWDNDPVQTMPSPVGAAPANDGAPWQRDPVNRMSGPPAGGANEEPASRIWSSMKQGWAGAPPLVYPSSDIGKWLENHGMAGLTTPFAPLAAGGALMGGLEQGAVETGKILGAPQLGRDVAGYIESGGMAGDSGLTIAPRGRGPAAAEVPIGGLTRSEATEIAREAKIGARAAARVERRVNQDIEAGSTTAVDVIDNLNKGRGAGKPLMLPDVLGANVAGEAGRVARAPGASKEIIESAYRARNLEAVPRLTSDINKALGETGAYQARADLEAARKAAAAPKYKAAFSRIEVSPEEAARLNHWLVDPTGLGQQALNRGVEIIAGEKHAQRETFDPAEYGVVKNEQGQWVLAGDKRNLRLYDAVKRGYDAVVESMRDPVTQRLNLNDYTRMVQQNRSEFNAELRDAFPRYAAALDAWGGPSRSIDALKFGEDALTNTPEVNAARLKSMSENDREFAKLGIAQKLRDLANSKGPLAAEFDKLAGSKYGAMSIRDRIRPFFSGDEELKKLVDGVDHEIKMARKGNEILGNSASAGRLAEDSQVSGPDIAGAGVAAAMGHHATLVHRVIDMIGKWLPKDDPELNVKIAQILSDPNMQPELSHGGGLKIPVPLPAAPSRGLTTP